MQQIRTLQHNMQRQSLFQELLQVGFDHTCNTLYTTLPVLSNELLTHFSRNVCTMYSMHVHAQGGWLTWRFSHRGSEAGKVDESIGHEEEGGDNLSYLVQLCCMQRRRRRRMQKVPWPLLSPSYS